MHFSWYFQQKSVLSGCWRCENCGSHSFPYRSLLLSTTVLNDISQVTRLDSERSNVLAFIHSYGN